jgi:hypothetical protein
MSTIDCQRCGDLLPELALGIADGDMRAEVLTHLSRCSSCRHELDALSVAADSVLLTGPVIEPPAGFESAVLDRLGNEPVAVRRAQPGRRSLLLAAAAVVVVFLAGLAVGRVGGDAGTHDLRGGDLAGPTGPAGQVLAYTGERSLLVVSLGPEVPEGTYEVVCEYAGGRTYTIGTLEQSVDRGSDPATGTQWSRSLSWPLDDLVRVRLVADGGGADLEARIST